ncbi:MAG TPA: (Fe-S)-binding protein [Dehalococcoidia bacterium]|nr:(Fe-S)-binding protein [Dehalococcoidia bacterium]
MPSYGDTLRCTSCGLCLSVCPTYREESIETSSPRGRLHILKAWTEGKLETNPNLGKQLYRCLGCQACSTICPSAVAIDRLVLEGRARLDQRGLAAWLRRYLIQGAKLSSRRLHLAAFLIRLYQRLGPQALGRSLSRPRLLPQGLREAETLLPRVPAQLLEDILPPRMPAPEAGQCKVGYFLNCLNNLALEEVGMASLKVLNAYGCDLTIPKGQSCCGMPALAYGETEIFREMARRNIDQFRDADVEVIITDCATCGHTLKLYGELLANDPGYAEAARNFSQKVRDITELLAQLPAPQLQPLEGVVTYHDPCHLGRGQRVMSQPRQLLTSTGLKLVEMPESDWCCGNAGSYLFTHPGLSLAILKKKVENARSTGADIIATACPGCLLQLRLGARRFGLNAQVLHPVQVLAQALSPTPWKEVEHAKA